jgi:hypothetical protein
MLRGGVRLSIIEDTADVTIVVWRQGVKEIELSKRRR